MNIGNNIAALRKAKGITQEALANELGVSAQAVSKWENNSSCPDVSLLTDIADYFNVTVDNLLRMNDEEIINGSAGNNERKPESKSAVNPDNFHKKVHIRIIQQNGKENNIRIPFKLVKSAVNLVSVFGIKKELTDTINSVLNSEDIKDFVEINNENGDHISISLE